MWEVIAQLSALTVFLVVGTIGLVFLVLSFSFGEIFHIFDMDTHLDADLHEGGPGFFNLKVMSVLVTAFGGVGALCVSRGFGVLSSSLFGLIGGIALAGIVYYFGRLLYSQQSSSLITSADLIGCKAEVIVGIPAGGTGQVRCLVGESMVDKIARSRDGGAIPQHSTVLIEEVSGESVIVSPWSSLREGRGLFSSSIEP
ncbi:MAG: hypothetical protein L0226_11430 [Acidobacteria bacterium]|nr:hypothetical protein [Acidobacteriota bacterium]